MLKLSASGVDGKSGENGSNGSSYDQTIGIHGKNGRNGANGSNAGKISITLKRISDTICDEQLPSEGSKVTFSIKGTLSNQSDVTDGIDEKDQKYQTIDTVYCYEGTPLEILAKGGNAGHGGNGGNGAPGIDGRSGNNAKHWTPAENGENGTDGGDAGSSGDPGNGGNGGPIEINVLPDEIYLLMMILCDVSAGQAGKPGQNGKPGRYGRGGKGGSGYENEQCAGSNGVNGRTGAESKKLPINGNNGKCGKVVINVIGQKSYTLNGLPAHSAFDAIVFNTEFDNGENSDVLEPNDQIFVRKIRIQNIGLIDISSDMMISVYREEDKKSQSLDQKLDLTTGSKTDVEGELVYSVPENSREISFSMKVSIGPTRIPVKSKKIYSLKVDHPLKIQPINYADTLCPNVTSVCTIRITNESSIDLGSDSKSNRKISLNTYIENGDFIRSEHLGLLEIKLIRAKTTYDVLIPITTNDISNFNVTHCAINTMLSLQPVRSSNQDNIRQIRSYSHKFQISRPFFGDRNSHVLLVINSETINSRIKRWTDFLSLVQMRFCMWNISAFSDSDSLADKFSGNTIVFFDDKLNIFDDGKSSEFSTNILLSRESVISFVDKGGRLIVDLNSSKNSKSSSIRYDIVLALRSFRGAKPIFVQDKSDIVKSFESKIQVFPNSPISPISPESSSSSVGSPKSLDHQDLSKKTIGFRLYDRYYISNISEKDLSRESKNICDSLTERFPEKRFVIEYDFKDTKTDKLCQYYVGDIHVTQVSNTKSNISVSDFKCFENQVLSLQFSDKLDLLLKIMVGDLFDLTKGDSKIAKNVIDAVLSDCYREIKTFTKQATFGTMPSEYIQKNMFNLNTLNSWIKSLDYKLCDINVLSNLLVNLQAIGELLITDWNRLPMSRGRTIRSMIGSPLLMAQ